MNGYNNATISTSGDRSNGKILKCVVDAMLDSLTIEQQTKMASYLLRAARQQARVRRADVHSTTPLIRIC